MNDQEALTTGDAPLPTPAAREIRAPSLLQSCDQLIDSRTPNFLRLYLNPWVAQVCLCLEHLAAPLLKHSGQASERCPSYLCNSRHEALAGALKLVRYTQANRSQLNRQVPEQGPDVSAVCIVVDDDGRYADFAATSLIDDGQLQYIPDVVCCASSELADVVRASPSTECIVYTGRAAQTATVDAARLPEVMTIRCVDAQTVELLEIDRQIRPVDVIVFDESFVNFDVPFAAMTCCRTVYSPWMRRSMAMFHSTTFQPSTLPAMHFLKCLNYRSPRIAEALREQLDAVMNCRDARHACWQMLYSESLSGLIQATGFDQTEPQASGHLISSGDRSVFDGVAGVACSVRGHNPQGYTRDVRQTLEEGLTSLDGELREELRQLSGLDEWVPAVSGASAVEHALKLALAARPDRPHVVTLKGGFGGKTLLALTGTSKPFYRKHVGPLYPHVTRIDPRSESVIADLDRVFAEHKVGVVQLELIQGVGGVRPIPARILEHLTELRRRHQCLLFADEIQTGMFRTGPFLRSLDRGFSPDLVTIGKGTSDMMFPFAATLYSERVGQLVEASAPGLPDRIRQHYDYPVGRAALLHVLRTAQREDWTARVREQSALFEQLLSEGLSRCVNVRDVRVFGMLIGIELDSSRGLNRLLGSRLAKFFSLAMLNHRVQPLLMGFCQYEPGVFKLTPGLLMTEHEIRSVCATIIDVLSRPALMTAANGIRQVLQNRFISRSRPVPQPSPTSVKATTEYHELPQRAV